MQFDPSAAKKMRKKQANCLLFFKRKTHTFVEGDYQKRIRNFILPNPVLTKSFI